MGLDSYRKYIDEDTPPPLQIMIIKRGEFRPSLYFICWRAGECLMANVWTKPQGIKDKMDISRAERAEDERKLQFEFSHPNFVVDK